MGDVKQFSDAKQQLVAFAGLDLRTSSVYSDKHTNNETGLEEA
ncbi:hypothetical protein [Paenibacillus sp. FSL F4-0087]